MTKTIFSFDLGTNSCGWAVLGEAKTTAIIDTGVRIVPSDPDFHGKFNDGNPASKNAGRTTKRGIRRNNQRWKQRRDRMVNLLKTNNMYPSEALLSVDRIALYELRARAVSEKVSQEELGRILLLLIQRRGFLSNRKSQSKEESTSEYNQKIADNTTALGDGTIGQFLWKELEANPYNQIRNRVFHRRDYRREVNLIWKEQQKHYPELLTGDPENPTGLYDTLVNRILFYQRPLKSAKHLVGKCTFEKGLRVCPKSSPTFQSFNVLQKLNTLRISKKGSREQRYLEPFEREKLLELLYDHAQLDRSGKLSKSKILKTLGLSKSIYKLNLDELDGDATYTRIAAALAMSGVDDIEQYLVYHGDEKDTLYQIWHLLYSEVSDEVILRLLIDRYGLTKEAALALSDIKFKSEYGSLSAKAIKNLLPHLNEGLLYSEACDAVGYDHSGYKSKVELTNKLNLITKGALRNPVVEQVLNQMVNITNALLQKHGAPDEIRVELARELRNSAKVRKKMSSANKKAKRDNQNRRIKLQDEFNYKIVNGRDIQRIRLWEETNHICLYCGKRITTTDFENRNADIEHILPKSRSANDALSNKILSHGRCNAEKNQQTGYDYVSSLGEERLIAYTQMVEELYAAKQINHTKYSNLLCTGEDIPDDFVNRQRQDTAYIVRAATKILRQIAPVVTTVPGSITNYLRREWGLDRVLEELNFPKYEKAGLLGEKEIKTGDGNTKMIPSVEDWSKREDHRHHALDAIIVGMVSRKIIFSLNNLNKQFLDEQGKLSADQKAQLKKQFEEETGLPYSDGLNTFTKRKDITHNPPMENIRGEVKKALNGILVSFKKPKSKAYSLNKNKIKGSDKIQTTLVPRGALHKDTIVGRTRDLKKVAINGKLSVEIAERIIHPQIKTIILSRLNNVNGNAKKVFSKSNYDKEPILWKGRRIDEVEIWDYRFTKRVKIDENLNDDGIKNIVDDRIKDLVRSYVDNKGGDPKKVLKNYLNDPIFTDPDGKQMLKRVKIFADGNYTPTRSLMSEEKPKPNDFAKLRNNHHAIVYKDENGNYSSKLVSFWDAIGKADIELNEDGKLSPTIDTSDKGNARFQYSLQINDLVLLDVSHETDISLMSLDNVSDKIFRIMSLDGSGSGLDIWYRHHLETSGNKKKFVKPLRGVTWERTRSNKSLARIRKVRINNLGELILE